LRNTANRGFGRPEQINPRGWTEAHQAAEDDKYFSVPYLAEKGELNARDENGQTPAHIAAREKHTDFLFALHRAGADMNVADKKGNTPAHLIAAHYLWGYENVFRLCSKKSLNAPNKAGFTPAHISADNGCQNHPKMLHEAGANLSARDRKKRTPAHHAAEGDHQAYLYGLEDAGAMLTARDKNGQTPAHIAAEHGYDGLLFFIGPLIRNFKTKDKAGNTPFNLAAKNGHEKAGEVMERRMASPSFDPRKYVGGPG
jgi:ankyrin